MAVKDAERWIQKTLNSLIQQSYEDWECIISLNGSSDSSEQICKSIVDNRFVLIKSDLPNKCVALNDAIKVSKRDMLCILDSDDLWHIDKLKLQLKKLETNNVDICGTGLTYIDENDNELTSRAPTLPCSDYECKVSLLNCVNPIANSSVLYYKNIHDKVGLYDTYFNGVEDYELWKRCLKNNLSFLNLEEKLLLHRIHNTSNFNSTEKQRLLKQEIDNLYVNND